MSRRIPSSTSAPPSPAYERIRSDLAAAIESGRLRERLPSEAELAAGYGVARMTVRQALAGLVDDGLVRRRRGVGTFVVDGARPREMRGLAGFSDDMRADGRAVATRMLDQRIVPAPGDVAKALELALPCHVTHVARLRVIDDEAMIVQHSWVPSERFPDIWTEPLLEDSLYATLRRRYGVTLRRAEQRIAAEPAGRELAQLLDVRAGSALLRVERITRDAANVPVEFARSWTRPGFEIATYIEA